MTLRWWGAALIVAELGGGVLLGVWLRRRFGVRRFEQYRTVVRRCP